MTLSPPLTVPELHVSCCLLMVQLCRSLPHVKLYLCSTCRFLAFVSPQMKCPRVSEYSPKQLKRSEVNSNEITSKQGIAFKMNNPRI